MTNTKAQAIATRNANILADFNTGNFSKAAIARRFGVDEKTVRRVVKAAGNGGNKPQVAKDVKASVKQKAQKAVGGAQKSAKASTTASVQSKSVNAPTQNAFSLGDKVQTEVGGAVGVIKSISKNTKPETIYYVLWPQRRSTIAFLESELFPAGKVPAKDVAPAQTGVKAALQAGQAVEYVITGDSIMLTLGNDVEIVDASHQNYKAIKQAIVAEDYKTAYDLMNISKAITKFTQGAISVRDGELYYGEMRLRSTLVTRILDMMAQGDEGFKSLVNFLERLLKNPSKSSVEQLWGFISHLDVDIDADGYIIGWKKVRAKKDGLFDSRTGKVPNDIGNIVEMPRHMVDDNRDVTCSQGLHVGAWDYVTSFSGDTILKVKVDPADVVAVPTDYNDMKMRAAKYTVVAVVDKDRKEVNTAITKPRVHVMVGTSGELLSKTTL